MSCNCCYCKDKKEKKIANINKQIAENKLLLYDAHGKYRENIIWYIKYLEKELEEL